MDLEQTYINGTKALYYFTDHSTLEKRHSSLTFGIRNHSPKAVNVRHRSGVSNTIHPCTEWGNYNRSVEMEHQDVWIDVELKAHGINDLHFHERKFNSHLDMAIVDAIKKEIERMENRGYSRAVNLKADINFTILLSHIKPNFKTNGYYSEILGTIIEVGVNGPPEPWLSEIPTLIEDFHNEHTEQTYMNFRDSLFEFIYVVDNLREINPIWTMRAGKPVKIVGVTNPNMENGIYIINSETILSKNYHIHITVNEMSDSVLRDYGLSFTEGELLTGTRTKEYGDLKLEISKLRKIINDRDKTLCDQETKYKEQIVGIEDKNRVKENNHIDKMRKLESKNNELNMELAEMKRLNNAQKEKTEQAKSNTIKDWITSMLHTGVVVGTFLMKLFKV